MNEEHIEIETRPIRVYPKIDVELTYQNFGSAWLCILRGATENIESVFNGLYNFCATNAKTPSYRNGSETLAVFWSDKKKLRRFFFNQFYIPRFDVSLVNAGKSDRKTIYAAMRYAKECILKLRETGHEFFIDFSNTFVNEAYQVGQVKAERPDNDFKDAVLANAFEDRSYRQFEGHVNFGTAPKEVLTNE